MLVATGAQCTLPFHAPGQSGQLACRSLQRLRLGVADALLGGRFAQAAYRAQLMPLIGDAQAQSLQGATGKLARLPWRVQWQAALRTCGDEQVQALSAGTVQPLNSAPVEEPTQR